MAQLTRHFVSTNIPFDSKGPALSSLLLPSTVVLGKPKETSTQAESDGYLDQSDPNTNNNRLHLPESQKLSFLFRIHAQDRRVFS
jgi:hypothetical protein